MHVDEKSALSFARGRSPIGAACALAVFAAAFPCRGIAMSSPGSERSRHVLGARLVLEDGQQGVAGETGIITVIERDGRFRVARFVDATVHAPHHGGTLDREALRELARCIAPALNPPLPRSIGEPSPVNARRLKLTYGRLSSTLLLRAGQDPLQAASNLSGPAADAAARFVGVWSTVGRLTSLVKGRDPSP